MSQPNWSINARTGPVRSYLDNMKIFACEGLVCIIDEREGREDTQYTAVTPDDLKERIDALHRPYRKKTLAQMTKAERQWYHRRRTGFTNCMECIREAKHMGDPSDPAVQAYWARHKSKSTVAISFSAGADPAGYPELPPIDLGPITGKNASIDHEIVNTPVNASQKHTKIHQPPRKKNRSSIILID